MEKIFLSSEETKEFLLDNKGVYLLTDQKEIDSIHKAMASYLEKDIFEVKVKEITFDRPIEIVYVMPSSGKATSENWLNESKSTFKDVELSYPPQLDLYTECSGFKSTNEWIETTIDFIEDAGMTFRLNKAIKLRLYALESTGVNSKSEVWLRSRMLLKIAF